MRYEYRVTSDAPGMESDGCSATRHADLDGMLIEAYGAINAGASWAEVQFVRVDDDGTFEVLRRLRLD